MTDLDQDCFIIFISVAQEIDVPSFCYSSYLIRFWATLINKPYNLFDQRIPSYVETSMEVISQVLIESCSLKAQQYTKVSENTKVSEYTKVSKLT